MTPDPNPTALSTLESIAYINENGEIPDQFAGKVGVYAIFDESETLQYIGYSRDVFLSLKQHLVRQPQRCYSFKVQTIDRPSRTILEEIRNAWIAENGTTPIGNGADEPLWSQAIDAKAQMTPEEKAAYLASDDLGRTKLLKQVARRVEAEVFAVLESRQIKMALRFDPKLKEEGLLSLK
ncbi:MAG TPA: GIY-YIG nuclease family protein [Trichocoleus sp.]|jgi:hypothetical protein